MKKKNGFTLVELLAVIVILGALMTMATLSVIGIMNKSKKDVGSFTVTQIEDAAKTYALDKNACNPSCKLEGDSIKETLKDYYEEMENKCDFTNASLTINNTSADITVSSSGIVCTE